MCLLCRTAVALLSEGHPEIKESTQLECQREGKRTAADAINAKYAPLLQEKGDGTVGYVH